MRSLDPRDATLTGSGWASSVGYGVASIWAALLAGRSGVRVVGADGDPSGLLLAAPAERPLLRTPVPEEQESQAKFLNSSGELAATVVREAFETARVSDATTTPAQRGLYIAQNDFSRAPCQDFRGAVVEATRGLTAPLEAEALNKASLHGVNPFVLLETLHNNAFSFITAAFGIKGPNVSLAGYEGSGLAALGLASRAVRTGRVRLAVGVGTGATAGPLLRYELSTLGQLSPAADPAGAPRPFDAARDGLVAGDGAAALVFEPLEVARARGSGPWAVVVGTAGATGRPPPGAFSPDAETIVQAARAALRDAGLRVSELGAIVAAGSGRRAEDRLMLAAIDELLDGQPVPVTSACGSLGHAAAGTDAGHALLAALALREGLLPPTAGFAQAEPGLERVQVARVVTPLAGPTVLVLAAGQDGQAHALVLAGAP